MIAIDMEMPKCCDECFALDDHGDYPFCLISQDQRGYTFNTKEKRMPTCPLKAQEARLVIKDDFANADEYGWLPAWAEEKIGGVVYCECITVDALKEKGIRYWTRKPTDEQREAVNWE